MSTCESIRVQIHCLESVTEKMEAVYDRITQRAYEHWLNNRTTGRLNVEFWSAAERELIWKPEMEVREWGHGVTVEIVCPDVDPSKIRLFTSPSELLALAPMDSAGSDRWLFRYLRFRQRIDHADASAEFESGSLRFEATLLNAPDEEKLHFRVA